MRPAPAFGSSILWFKPRRSTSSQAPDSFGKLPTRPTTAVFSTLLPSLGRVLYQWNSQTLPCFLRASFVNQPRCDISALSPQSAGDCLGSNHTGSIPRGKPTVLRRGCDRSGKFAQAETPDTSRTFAERMAWQYSSARKIKNATPGEG